MAEFKLSASLSGHDQDVKAVAFPNPKTLLSGSRDGTVQIWNLLSERPPVYDPTVSSHVNEFVNAVAYLPPSTDYPEGLIISGGKAAVIDVRAPSTKPQDNSDRLLAGHSQNVCTLDVDPAGKFVVSGSWDHDARIWPVGKWECDAVLPHDHAVWAVIVFDSDTIVTASADQHIRVFNRSGKLVRKFRGSQEPLRALCKLPKNHTSGADIASAGNDGPIRLWTLTGESRGELNGHSDYIYSIASLPSGELVSSAEDRTVRVWRGKECVQTITHPAISVWQVAVCAETGDIVTGASDRVIRVFTRNPELIADVETLKQFEDSVKESSIPQQAMPEINKEKLPGPEFLTQKAGTKDGQVQMIKELNGNVTAHTWSSGNGQWVNVGTVVDAVGSSGKKEQYNGQQYDFVFDVDIEDGKPPLKLPYNLSENPYEAATKFVNNNKLPITYLDQVANFITSNTQGQTIGQSAQSAAPDPWGSDNRYRPGETNTPPPVPTPQATPQSILPQKQYLNILVTKPAAIEKKINELNQALIENGQKELSLNPTELRVLAELRKHIETSGATSSSQSVLGGLDLVVKLVTQWPYKDRLPGLDLLRLLAVAPQTATFALRGGNLIDAFEAGATEASPPAENHIMMAVRGFGNLFESAEGRKLAMTDFEKIQNLVTSSVANSSNRNLLVAAVTLWVNYAVYFTQEKDISLEYVVRVMDSLTKVLSTQNDAETVYRGLVALGTLMKVDDEAKAAARDIYGVGGLVKRILAKAVDIRVKSVSKEIIALLS